MSNARTYLAATITAVAALVGINGIAYAATGQSLILGHSNDANALTTLHRTTRGPALDLQVRSGSAPLRVNSPRRVAHLNADLVDGKHAAELAPHAIRFILPTLPAPVSRVTLSFASPSRVPYGNYFVSYSVLARVSVAGGTVGCMIQDDAGAPQLESYGASAAIAPLDKYSTANNSGVVQYRTGRLHLVCFTTNGGEFNLHNHFYRQRPNAPNNNYITLIPLNRLERIDDGVAIG